MSKDLKKYWRTNIRYVTILLIIWFFVAFVLSIFLADQLNVIRIGGFKLGFWIAQQGAIYVFVILIFAYVKWMRKLDDEYEVSE